MKSKLAGSRPTDAQTVGQDVAGDDPSVPRHALGRHLEADAVEARHRVEELAPAAAEIEEPAATLGLPHAPGQRVEAGLWRTAATAAGVHRRVDTRVVRRAELRRGEQEAAVRAAHDPAMHRLGPAGQEIRHRVAPVARERGRIDLDEARAVADRTGTDLDHALANAPGTRRRRPKRVARANRHSTRA